MEMFMEIPGNKSIYEKQFQDSIHIFEESFKGFQKSTFGAQKDEYEKSMGESLKAMQDSAAGLMNSELTKLKTQLSNDYHSYLSQPSSSNLAKVQEDIESLKNASE